MYYLAYKKDKNYIKLDYPKPGRSIGDIVTYTLNFKNIDDLICDLYNKGIIKTKNIKLSYIYSKKDSNKYKILSSGKIYTLEQKAFFISKYIKKYLDFNKYNVELMAFLYKEYLVSTGVIGNMKKYISSLKNDKLNFAKIMERLSKIPLTNETKYNISKLINNIDNINDSLITDLINSIDNNLGDSINVFFSLRNNFDYMYLPQLYPLERLYKISLRANNMGIENYENDLDAFENSEPIIREFVKKVIYYYDYKKDCPELNKDGSPKIYKKGLFDLGVLLEEYYSYSLALNKKSELLSDSYNYSKLTRK